MQVNGTVGTTNVKWPFEFKDVAKAFSFVKVSFDWPSVGCVLSQTTGNSFYVRLLGYTLFPPALIFAMFLPTLWAAAAGRGAALTARMAGMAIRKALLVLFFVYPKVRSALPVGRGLRSGCWYPPSDVPQVSQTVLNGLVCTDLGLDGRFLKWDLRVDCDSADYAPYRAYGLAMVPTWILGYPLLLLGLLFRYNVPRIAARKRQRAEVGAFMEYSLRLENLAVEHPGAAHAADAALPPALTAQLAWLLGCICKVVALPPQRSAVSSVKLRRRSTAAEAIRTAGALNSLDEANVDKLRYLAELHSVERAAALTKEQLVKALNAVMHELIALERVTVPCVFWDLGSPDADERLACDHLGQLITAYKPAFWWYGGA